MRVNVDQPYTLAELKPKLEAAFPEYTVKFRGAKVLIIGQGKVAGAQIFGEKKKFIRLNETFPTMGGQMLFALSILLLGVFIPFIVYLTSMKPKQVKLRNAVANFLSENYGAGAIPTKKEELATADLLDQ
jgi:hypothetical protein